MRRWVKRVLAGVVASAAMMVVAVFPACAGEWRQDGNDWRWQNDDGSYPVNQWAWIDGNHDGIAECYYLGADSYMLSNTTIQGMVIDMNGCMTEFGVIQTTTLAGKDFEKAFEMVVDMGDIQVIDYRDPTETSVNTDVDYAEIDPQELAYRIVELVNVERARAGKGELAVNDELMDNAMLRAEEISELFSHTRPNGDSCTSAISINYSLIGENIAWEKLDTSENIAHSVTKGWLNSSGHKAIMMNDRFEVTGIGVSVAEDGVYIVQVFVK